MSWAKSPAHRRAVHRNRAKFRVASALSQIILTQNYTDHLYANELSLLKGIECSLKDLLNEWKAKGPEVYEPTTD
jgi:hypothetical protein